MQNPSKYLKNTKRINISRIFVEVYKSVFSSFYSFLWLIVGFLEIVTVEETKSLNSMIKD